MDEQGNVFGVASENFNIQIDGLIASGTTCYQFNPDNWQCDNADKIEFTPLEIEAEKANLDARLGENNWSEDPDLKLILKLKKAQKAVNFLVDMPPGFFADLMQKHKNPEGDVLVDMESLASILTASYTLEEDDLHKGNIGFYVTEDKDSGKKKFTFFKIDHDLMFIDSIMSRKDAREAHWYYKADSFKITPKDLDGFPDLQDSGNHYWPTKNPLMVKGDKAYKDENERRAWANLNQDPVFNAAKWNNFLKYCLIPKELVMRSLTEHLDPKDDADKITMIQNSVTMRIAELKQALMMSPGFIEHLRTGKGNKAIATIREEIQLSMKDVEMDDVQQEQELNKIDKMFAEFTKLANYEHRSPLMIALSLDCYDFSYKGKCTDIDISIAIQKFKDYQKNGDHENTFKYACIVEDLANRGWDSVDIEIQM